MTATATRHQAPDLGLHDVQAVAYTVPTDALEADGTLAWDSTTLVLVQQRTAPHLHLAVAADGGVLKPLDAPGHGLEWRADEAARCRVA